MIAMSVAMPARLHRKYTNGKGPTGYKTRGALSLLVGPVGLEPTTKGL